jgi:mRNA interferase MazF
LKRGELYRVYRGSQQDPRKYRVFAIVSRQTVIDSSFSTIICAPVYTTHHGISTQVQAGLNEGLKHDSCIYCDDLVSIPKNKLTDFVGTLSPKKIQELNKALKIAVGVE